MGKGRKVAKKQKLVYLQEDMGLMSEFDFQIFDFMFRSQNSDINCEIKHWFKTL